QPPSVQGSNFKLNMKTRHKRTQSSQRKFRLLCSLCRLVAMNPEPPMNLSHETRDNHACNTLAVSSCPVSWPFPSLLTPLTPVQNRQSALCNSANQKSKSQIKNSRFPSLPLKIPERFESLGNPTL